jgi:hypothetical protein
MECLLGLDYVNPNQEIPNPSEARHNGKTRRPLAGMIFETESSRISKQRHDRVIPMIFAG